MPALTFSKPFVCTLAICLLLLCSVDAGRRHRQRQRSDGAPPQYTYAVFDGIAQTHVVETQGQPPPPPLPSRKHPGTVARETCELISCFTHEDCAYNGCGGYYCFHCETCEKGRILGTCLWDRDSIAKNCPPVHCHHQPEAPSTSGHTAVTTKVTTTVKEQGGSTDKEQGSSTEQPEQEETSGERGEGNKPNAGGISRPHKKWNPWEESFSELRMASLNKTEWAEPREKKKQHGMTHYPISVEEGDP